MISCKNDDVSIHIKSEYHCDVCGKSFTNESDLKLHQGTHAPSKGKVGDLKLHSKVHVGEEPLICEICKKGFIQKLAYDNHVAEAHSKPAVPVICKLCGKTYAKRSELVEHHRIHSGEMPHQCEICSKAFRVKSALCSHYLIHMNEKSFTCEICGKRFRTKHEVNVHKRKKPHSCKLCRVRYHRKGDLRLHLQSVKHARTQNMLMRDYGLKYSESPYYGMISSRNNSGTMQPFGKEPYIKSESRISTPSKPKLYSCEICDKSFSYLYTLRKHKLRLHPDEIYVCEVCGNKYTYKCEPDKPFQIAVQAIPNVCEVCTDHIYFKKQLKV